MVHYCAACSYIAGKDVNIVPSELYGKLREDDRKYDIGVEMSDVQKLFTVEYTMLATQAYENASEYAHKIPIGLQQYDRLFGNIMGAEKYFAISRREIYSDYELCREYVKIIFSETCLLKVPQVDFVSKDHKDYLKTIERDNCGSFIGYCQRDDVINVDGYTMKLLFSCVDCDMVLYYKNHDCIIEHCHMHVQFGPNDSFSYALCADETKYDNIIKKKNTENNVDIVSDFVEEIQHDVEMIEKIDKIELLDVGKTDEAVDLSVDKPLMIVNKDVDLRAELFEYIKLDLRENATPSKMTDLALVLDSVVTSGIVPINNIYSGRFKYFVEELICGGIAYHSIEANEIANKLIDELRGNSLLKLEFSIIKYLVNNIGESRSFDEIWLCKNIRLSYYLLYVMADVGVHKKLLKQYARVHQHMIDELIVLRSQNKNTLYQFMGRFVHFLSYLVAYSKVDMKQIVISKLSVTQIVTIVRKNFNNSSGIFTLLCKIAKNVIEKNFDLNVMEPMIADLPDGWLKYLYCFKPTVWLTVVSSMKFDLNFYIVDTKVLQRLAKYMVEEVCISNKPCMFLHDILPVTLKKPGFNIITIRSLFSGIVEFGTPGLIGNKTNDNSGRAEARTRMMLLGTGDIRNYIVHCIDHPSILFHYRDWFTDGWCYLLMIKRKYWKKYYENSEPYLTRTGFARLSLAESQGHTVEYVCIEPQVKRLHFALRGIVCKVNDVLSMIGESLSYKAGFDEVLRLNCNEIEYLLKYNSTIGVMYDDECLKYKKAVDSGDITNITNCCEC